MTKQELLNKLAAKAAEAQALETAAQNLESSINEMETKDKSKLTYFKIHWSEAGDVYDMQEFTTWKEAQEAMIVLWNIADMKPNEGYCKTKIEIIWNNGKSIIDRLDLGFGEDFNPTTTTIGEYLSPCTSVMYNSNMMTGDRDGLQWTDAATDAQQQTQEAPAAPQEETNDIPTMLKALLNIVDVIQESDDRSPEALTKAAEQVEKCQFYITYLESLLPILKLRVNNMIEQQHKPTKVSFNIPSVNHNLN